MSRQATREEVHGGIVLPSTGEIADDVVNTAVLSSYTPTLMGRRSFAIAWHVNS